MKQTFQDVPGWTFEIEEVSANVYEVTATDGVGHRVQVKGTNPYELLEEARKSARKVHESAGGSRLRRRGRASSRYTLPRVRAPPTPR